MLGRNVLQAQETKATQENEDREREVAQRLSQATLAQVKLQLEGDLEKVRASLPTREAQAVETAKDMKYIRDRQQTLNIVFATVTLSGTLPKFR